MILIDSFYRNDKIYYPQAFLEECKYKVKNKTTKRIKTKDLTDFDSDSDSNSDSEINKMNLIMELNHLLINLDKLMKKDHSLCLIVKYFA